jgi:hypothetical protein
MPRSTAATSTVGSYIYGSPMYAKFGNDGVSTIVKNQLVITVNPVDTAFNFRSNKAWTVEFWMQVKSGTRDGGDNFFAIGDSDCGYSSGGTANSGSFWFRFKPAQPFGMYFDNGEGAEVAFGTDTWRHCAIVSYGNGSNMFYIDGTAFLGDASGWTSTGANKQITFGGGNSSNPAVWYDEIRISDVARYSSNFTPPTAAFVNDPNTIGLFHLDYGSYSDDTTLPFKEANATLTSSFTLSPNGGKLIEINDTSDYTWASPPVDSWDGLDYWIFTGVAIQSQFSTVCLMPVTGNAAVSSSASLSTSVSVIRGATVTLSSSFTQTTYGNRLKAVDLYAFSDAQIALLISRLRDTNITANTYFNISTDYIRIKTGGATADATASISAESSRSRAASMATQAAFSFAVTADKVKSASADLQSTATVGLTLGNVVPASASLTVTASQAAWYYVIRDAVGDLWCYPQLSADVGKILQGSSATSSSTTVSATISHIHGAGITAFTNATVSAIPKVTRQTPAALESIVSLSEFVYNIKQLQSSQSSSTAVSISAVANKVAVAGLSSQSSVSATISHIEGADITAFTNASVSVVGERTRDYSSAVNSAVTTSITALKIKQLSSAVNSATTVNANADQIKGITENLSSAFTQTGVISHIHGADITAFTNATVSATAVTFKGIIQSITSQANVSAVISVRYSQSSTITVRATVVSYPYVLLRNIAITQKSGSSYTAIDWTTEASKWGTGSLKIGNVPYTATNHYQSGSVVNNGTDLKYFTNGYTYTSTNGTSWTRSSNNLASNVSKMIWTGSEYAGRTGNAVYRSSDGNTWTTTTISIYDSIFGTCIPQGGTLEYFSGYWYVGTQVSNGVILFRSNNLSTWTRVQNFNSSGYISGDRRWVSSVNTGSKLYFLTQIGGTGNSRNIVSSSNGTSWTIELMPSTYGQEVTELAYGNGMLILSSYNYTPTYNFYLHSTPVSSISWTTRKTNTGNSYGDISYLGTSWFYSLLGVVYAGDLDSMTALTISNSQTERIGKAGYIAGKYVIPRNDGVLYSTSATSGYQTQTTSVNSNLPGYISYSDASSDLSNWKTLDFWIAGNGYSSYGVISQSGFMDTLISNNYLVVTFSNPAGTNYASFYTGNYPANNAWNTNGWNHIRIVKSNGVMALFCNGIKVTNQGYGSNYFPETLTTPIVFGGSLQVDNPVYIDEFLISDELKTDPSAASITVPTGVWSSDSNTDLLLHFENSITDDSRYQVIPTSYITAVAIVSAKLTGNQKGRAALSAVATFTAIGTKGIEANLVAFSNATVLATAKVTRDNASALVSNASVSADENRYRGFDSSLTSAASTNVINDRLRDNAITTQSAFTQSSAVNKTASALARADSQATVTAYITRIQEILLIAFSNGSMSAVGTVIRRAQSNQSSVATISATSVKTVYGASQQLAESSVSTIAVLTRSVIIITQSVATEVAVVVATRILTAELNAIASLSATANANTKQGVSSLSTAATLSATITKTAGANSQLSSQANQASTVSKITGYSSTLATAFTVYILANVSGKIEMLAFSNASLTVTVRRNRYADSALSSAVTVVANTYDSLAKQASAGLTAIATQTATAVKRVNPTLNFESIASELSVVVKQAAGSIALASAFTTNTIVTVNRRATVSLASVATVNATVRKTARTVISVSSQSTLAATVVKTVRAVISTQAIASTLTVEARIRRSPIDCSVVATLVGTAIRRRNTTAVLASAATVQARGAFRINVSVAVIARANISTQATKRVKGAAAITSAMTFVAEVREIHIEEIVYMIPPEDWAFTIISEDRTLSALQETRVYAVQSESRNKKVISESRIYKIRRT